MPRANIHLYNHTYTLLVMVNKTGAVQTFKLKKWGQICKLRKKRGKHVVRGQNGGRNAIGLKF
jgi:hypothetical protein